MYDVIIIGGGPAGLTAALYSARRGMKTLVLSRDIGGQITRTDKIENYPGIESITGVELGMKLFNQAKKFGAEITFDEVKEIRKKADGFTLKTNKSSLETKSVILAFGKKPRELQVPGEDELKGRGVSYCATCDAPFFKDKTVAIVGGGNSALEAALLSAQVAEKVYLIHRSDQFSGEAVMIEKVKKTSNIEIVVNSEVKEILGKDKVEGLTLKDAKKLTIDGIIIEIGFMIDRSLVKDFVKLDSRNQVEVNSIQETSVEGIFAAGDLTTTPYKQVIIAAAEGAKAALGAFDYVQKSSGKKGILADWH